MTISGFQHAPIPPCPLDFPNSALHETTSWRFLKQYFLSPTFGRHIIGHTAQKRLHFGPNGAPLAPTIPSPPIENPGSVLDTQPPPDIFSAPSCVIFRVELFHYDGKMLSCKKKHFPRMQKSRYPHRDQLRPISPYHRCTQCNSCLKYP